MKSKSLKTTQQLAWSPVVANNAMNRKRQAFGVNSYQKEIRINPLNFLLERYSNEKLHWIDLCCGEGNALIQVAKDILENKWESKIQLEGIDLVDYFSDATGYEAVLSLKQQNLQEWQPTRKFNLITIVHGLHYIGDKLALIEKASQSLQPGGLCIGNLDLDNIKMEGSGNSKLEIKSQLKRQGVEYNARSKIVKIHQPISITKLYQYIGADDTTGPNYTGQPVVDSYYRKLE